MKKLINSFLVISIIVFSPAIRAQGHGPIASAQFSNENIQGEASNFSEVETQSHELPRNPSYKSVSEDSSPLAQDDSSITPYQEGSENQEAITPLTPPNAIPYELTSPEATPSDYDENEGTPVGQAASEGSKAAKKKQWQNIALATIAIAAVVTALVLIANNDGHRKDD